MILALIAVILGLSIIEINDFSVLELGHIFVGRKDYAPSGHKLFFFNVDEASGIKATKAQRHGLLALCLGAFVA